MIKIYRKKGTVEAEQFDGSDEMVRRYGLVDRGGHIVDGLHVDNACFIWTNEGHLKINYHDWIATGINGEHWPISDEVFKKTYVELPVIPSYVVKYMESCKRAGETLFSAIFNAEYMVEDYTDYPGPTLRYISRHCETFSRAWLDGYRVEDSND